MKFAVLSSAIGLGLALFLSPSAGEACTRVLYTGEDRVVIAGRTLDWEEDISTNLWVFPKGLKRNGGTGAGAIAWTSKYGSVAVAGYGIATADGMNEKGLVADVLYLAESDYGVPKPSQPTLSTLAWGQYVLDNFATVSETVEALKKNPFALVAPKLPNGDGAQFHLSISDPTGDSAIFEYVDGELVVHHGKQYQVMTNSPSYNQQLALNTYWEEIGGTNFLPGTSRAADRFARAFFYLSKLPRKVDPHFIQSVPQQSYENQSVACVLSLLRGVSVPLGVSTPNEPNLASTLWRTVADQKNLIYYYDSSTSPNVFWVELADLDFSEKGETRKLDVANGEIYAGNVAAKFVKAAPFQFK